MRNEYIHAQAEPWLWALRIVSFDPSRESGNYLPAKKGIISQKKRDLHSLCDIVYKKNA